MVYLFVVIQIYNKFSGFLLFFTIIYNLSLEMSDEPYFFLQDHIAKTDRTYDQMLQAARSGKQNIVEGRSDAASSAEIEIKLFGVAKGSLHELLNDYLDFMRTRDIEIWTSEHPI